MTDANQLQRYLTWAHSADADEREEAARELKAFFRNSHAVDAMVEMLGDSDWRVRRAAVESFLEMRPLEVIPKILQSLYDEENAGRRNAAIDILTKFGKEVVPYLEPHLTTQNLDVHMFLVNILGDLRDDTFLNFVTESLKHPDINIISAAILALGKIGHPESLPQLLPFLDGSDMWLTFQTIEAAGEMQDPATIASLVSLASKQYFRKAVVKALSRFHHPDAYAALAGFLTSKGKVDADALRALYEVYHSPGPSPLKTEEQQELRDEVRNAITPEIIQNLLQEYTKADSTVRKIILEALGWAQAAEAVPLMLQVVHDPEIQESAAQALVHSGKEAIAPILSLLQQGISEDETLTLLAILNESTVSPDVSKTQKFLNDDSSEIRLAAFRLLARSFNAESTRLFMRGIMDSNRSVNEICREPLLSLCRKSKSIKQEVVEYMQQSIHSIVPRERANSLEFLILLQGEESFPLLFSALKDEEAEVRQKAVTLMGTGYHHQFQRPLIAALADEDSRVRELAATALKSYSSPEVVEALISSMRDEALWVRIATYQSLAAIGDERVLSAFLQQLESENPISRAVLLRSLGQFREQSVKDVLLKYLNSEDPEIRKSACESLGNFNDNDIVFRLFTLLQNDSDWGVRVAAIRALTNIHPFRLQEALLERLRMDDDPFVRKEILVSLQKLSTDYLPVEIYDYLLDKNLADAAYEFLISAKLRFAKQIQEASRSQAPAIRRIVKTVLS